MSAKTTYVATAPDGTEITRTSARIYTHAVLVFSEKTELVKDENGEYVRGEDGRIIERVTGKSWGQIGFAGREDLAAKTASTWSKKGIKSFEKIIVVPAVAR